ncbi:MAG: hypothetical protein LN590_07335 [Rickettsia endosymbiont of Glossina mortisans submortisans]|nr:hypothetical protein [Rickettsia endosymbiont of Glossina mortisans submortisans]
MNINDLPDSHHKEIAGIVYNDVTHYKTSNGRGQSEHNIDEHDKIKIAANCYEQLCSSKAWSIKAKAHLNESLAILERRAELQRDIENDQVASKLEREQFRLHQEQIKHEILVSNTVSKMFTTLEKDQKYFVALNGNIKYEIFNSQFQALAEQALEHQAKQLLPKLKDVVAALERNNVFTTSDILAQLKGSTDLAETYKHFDSSLEHHQLETQHQQIRQDKVDAKTTDEMLTAIGREHEFFKSLDGKIKYAEKYDSSILSAISNAKTVEQEQLITNMHNMIVYTQKHGILNDHEILNQFNSNNSRNALNNLSKTCEKHYMDHHNENIKQLLDDEHVMVGLKKYTCPLKYMKHEMQNDIPSFVDEKQIATTFAKVKAEVKELRLERELEHTMTMRF